MTTATTKPTKPKIPLNKIDPSKTGAVRRAFMADLIRRFKMLANDIHILLIEYDVLGARPVGDVLFNVGVSKQAWKFLTADKKVAAFRRWFAQQVNTRIYSVDSDGDPWTSKYAMSAYKRGITNGFIKADKSGYKRKTGLSSITAEQFLRAAFQIPERVSKAKLLATRVFEELNGVTTQMSVRMGRVLADGILRGDNPRTIARTMAADITGISRKRALVIARTEIIHAQAEGQLDAFEDLGVDEVGADVEWSTAGDDRVCPLCEELEGVVMSIEDARGLLPRHPNCRCAWIPALRDRKEESQIWSQRGRLSAIKKSVKREGGQGVSVWAGKDLL